MILLHHLLLKSWNIDIRNWFITWPNHKHYIYIYILSHNHTKRLSDLLLRRMKNLFRPTKFMDVLCKQMGLWRWYLSKTLVTQNQDKKPLLMYKVPKFVHNVNYICQNSQMKSLSINNKYIRLKEIFTKNVLRYRYEIDDDCIGILSFFSPDLYG